MSRSNILPCVLEVSPVMKVVTEAQLDKEEKELANIQEHKTCLSRIKIDRIGLLFLLGIQVID